MTRRYLIRNTIAVGWLLAAFTSRGLFANPHPCHELLHALSKSTSPFAGIIQPSHQPLVDAFYQSVVAESRNYQLRSNALVATDFFPEKAPFEHEARGLKIPYLIESGAKRLEATQRLVFDDRGQWKSDLTIDWLEAPNSTFQYLRQIEGFTHSLGLPIDEMTGLMTDKFLKKYVSKRINEKIIEGRLNRHLSRQWSVSVQKSAHRHVFSARVR